mgnify:CR=1 FL=1
MAITINAVSIYISSDSGVSWTAKTNAGSRDWRGIASTPDFNKLAATVANGNIYVTIDGGDNWSAWTNAGVKYWSGIACSPDFSMIIAAVWGVTSDFIYVSLNGGVTWSALAWTRKWSGVTASSDFVKMAACITSSSIYMSVDSGVSWTAVTGAGVKAWRGITSSPDFVKLADAYGCHGLRCESPEDVDATIEKAMGMNDAPLVIDFVVNKDAMVWPMVAAGTSNDDIMVARAMAPDWGNDI